MTATRQCKRSFIGATTAISGRKKRKNRLVLPASKCCTVPPIRMEKVLAIRQQLAEDRYDFDGRLNVVMDRLLKELNV